MGVKIKFSNADHVEAARCVNWLNDNVGERVPHSGSAIKGLGWRVDCNSYDSTYVFELTDDVDKETQTMFLLRWA
jgi:hypothetical protein